MKTKILILPIFFIVLITNAQSFEGTITYKVEMINPNPVQIQDSLWQEKLKEKFGEKRCEIQKYYYKNNKYMYECQIDEGKKSQVYNPKDGLIYSWVAKTDSLVTINSKMSRDDFLEIEENDEVKTILNIKCKSIIVKTRFQKIKIWYNSNYLKIDYDLYKWHIYNNLKYIYQKIKCLPLQIEKFGEMGKLVQTATEFEETAIGENKFIIPKIENVFESKEN